MAEPESSRCAGRVRASGWERADVASTRTTRKADTTGAGAALRLGIFDMGGVAAPLFSQGMGGAGEYTRLVRSGGESTVLVGRDRVSGRNLKGLRFFPYDSDALAPKLAGGGELPGGD